MPVFLFIGLTRIVDMGTGVNAQIIGTSNRWRFELFSGLILLLLTLPMNYWLAKKYGVIGPAIADLFSFTAYNGIRCIFLYKVFNMQPFTIKSLYTVVLGLAGYFICYGLFSNHHGHRAGSSCVQRYSASSMHPVYWDCGYRRMSCRSGRQ